MSTLPPALGHVRNATWQLMAGDDPTELILALDCLDLEALLNPHNVDPAVVPPEPDPAADLVAAERLLEADPDAIPPAAWAALRAINLRLG